MRVVPLFALVLTSACASSSSGGWSGAYVCPDAGGDADAGPCVPIGGDGAGSSDGATSADVGPVQEERTAETICARWKTDTADLTEGKWNGSATQCNAGELPQKSRDNTLKMVNLVRYLADLPAVIVDEAKSADAQACSLIMFANGKLSHTPPQSWKCWSSDGATAAGKSNLSTDTSVSSVQNYMVDSGANNADTLGHRRWILSNSLGPIGIGGTSNGSCLHVIGGKGKVSRPFTAWPAPGPFPLAALTNKYGQSVDATGWSIQSDQIGFAAAQVTVTADGQDLPVKTHVLKANYGSSYAIRILPQGWKSQAGVTYTVTVSKAGPKPWSYDVEMVDCAK